MTISRFEGAAPCASGSLRAAMATLLTLLPPGGEFRVCWIDGMKHFCIRGADQRERLLCWTRNLPTSDLTAVFGDGRVPSFVDVTPTDEPFSPD